MISVLHHRAFSANPMLKRFKTRYLNLQNKKQKFLFVAASVLIILYMIFDVIPSHRQEEVDRKPCLNKPQFTSRYKDGENPYFGAKNDTAISLFLTAFREAALASGTEPMLAAGSLLGWRRHCKFNAHDGDIDLHVFKKGWNLEIFERTYISSMQKAGFSGSKLGVRRVGLDHYMLGIPDLKKALGFAHIDLYVLLQRGELAIHNKGKHWWTWFPWSWVQPIKYQDVYGVQLGILHESDLYIEHFYGSNWKEHLDENNHVADRDRSMFLKDSDPDWEAVDSEHFKTYQTSDGSWSYTNDKEN